MSDWYLYDEDGDHEGPFSSDELLIRVGDDVDEAWITAERWFELPGMSGWRRILDVPELAQIVHARRASGAGLEVVGFKPTSRGNPEFGSAILMVPKKKPP